MPEALPEKLKTATELIQTGQIREARAILGSYIRLHPESEEAWFLLSYVAPQKKLQVDCLLRLLSLNPNHQEARARLNKLNPPAPVRPAPGQAVVPVAPPPDQTPDQQKGLLEPPADEGTRPSLKRLPAQPFEYAASAPYNDTLPARPASEEMALAANAPESGPVTPPITDSGATLFDFVGTGSGTPPFLSQVNASPKRVAEAAQFSTTENSPKQKGPKKSRFHFLVVFAQLIGVLAVIGGLLFLNNYRPGIIYLPQPTATQDYSQPPTPIYTPVITKTVTATSTFVMSVTPTITLSPTPSPRSTHTQTITPTIVQVDAVNGVAMDEIQKQVVGLRGLPDQGPVDRSLLSFNDVQQQLSGELLTAEYQARLKRESQTLAVLGLVDPNYDLSTLAINLLADPYGGIYLPWRQEIIVMGLRFGPVLRYGYAQELDHFLIDKTYDGSKLGIGPTCLLGSQRCQAINALYQGDSLLLISQWAKKYASAADNQEIANFKPLQQMFTEPTPPAYATQLLKFPLTAGLNFVKTLFAKGGWATVNLAFIDPPTSTMQILHPDKYLARRIPVAVTIPNAEASLGPDWQLKDSGTLGEFNTSLLLDYGAKISARIEENTALTSTAGWSGDAFQVYTNGRTSKNALVVKWAWESGGAMDAFRSTMTNHLQALYTGATQDDQVSGSCWQLPDIISCLYSKNKQALWLVSPDQATFMTLLKLNPDFP